MVALFFLRNDRCLGTFQLSSDLIFADKARSLPIEWSPIESPLRQATALPANIRKGRKRLTVTKRSSLSQEDNFTKLLGVIIIKIEVCSKLVRLQMPQTFSYSRFSFQGAMTFNITTVSITTFRCAKTFSRTKLSIMTFSIMGLVATLITNEAWQNDILHTSIEYHYVQCR